MEKREITEIIKKTEQILENRKEEVCSIEEKIANARKSSDKAREEMEKATKNSDVKAYQKAKNDKRDAEDATEMYSMRLDNLTSQPLINKGEYEKGVKQVLNALENVTEEAGKRIIECMEQIREIANECEAEITRGNNALYRWQHEIFRDKAEQLLANGNAIHMDSLEQRYRDFLIPNLAGYILKNGYYENLKKRLPGE